MIQSQIVLHRFEAVMRRAGWVARRSGPDPPGGTVAPLRVPARRSNLMIISRAVHNCPEVLQEDRQSRLKTESVAGYTK